MNYRNLIQYANFNLEENYVRIVSDINEKYHSSKDVIFNLVVQ